MESLHGGNIFGYLRKERRIQEEQIYRGKSLAVTQQQQQITATAGAASARKNDLR